MAGHANLAQARHVIDLVFAEHVGPVYRPLSDEASAELERKGHTGPGAIHRYITMLGAHITDPYRRAVFKQQAFRGAFGVRSGKQIDREPRVHGLAPTRV